MALDDIFVALEEQADVEIETVLQDARDQAAAIAEQATDDAEAARSARLEQAEKVTRSEASQSVNAAKLEGKKKVAAVKEIAVDTVFDQALDLLSGARGSSDYPAVFQALAQEALKGMSGDVEVYVDPADEALARSTMAALGVDAPIKPEISTRGGLVVAMQGGRIRRRNTLEDRLEKVRQSAQADVAEILFS